MGKCFKISLSICEEPSADMISGMLKEQKKQKLQLENLTSIDRGGKPAKRLNY